MCLNSLIIKVLLRFFNTLTDRLAVSSGVLGAKTKKPFAPRGGEYNP